MGCRYKQNCSSKWGQFCNDKEDVYRIFVYDDEFPQQNYVLITYKHACEIEDKFQIKKKCQYRRLRDYDEFTQR